MTPDDRRSRIEHWVSDCLDSESLRAHAGLVREYAPSVLVAFLRGACEARGVDPADIEAPDLKSGLLQGVAALEIPASVRGELPALCGDFLAELQTQGRLSGGRELGLRVRALRPAYLEATGERGTPFVAGAERLGRNDPCPCGSGRKYKKCCLGRLGP